VDAPAEAAPAAAPVDPHALPPATATDAPPPEDDRGDGTVPQPAQPPVQPSGPAGQQPPPAAPARPGGKD
jgi:hypothetical protein